MCTKWCIGRVQFLSLMPTQNELFKINTVPVSSYWLMLFEDFNIFYSSCWKWPPWPSVPTKKDCSKEKITELVQIYYPNWEQNSGQDPDPNTMYLWSPTLEFQQYTFFFLLSVLWSRSNFDRLRLQVATDSGSGKKNLLHKFKEKNSVLKNKRR